MLLKTHSRIALAIILLYNKSLSSSSYPFISDIIIRDSINKYYYYCYY